MWKLDTLILASHESMDKKIPLTPKFKIGGKELKGMYILGFPKK